MSHSKKSIQTKPAAQASFQNQSSSSLFQAVAWKNALIKLLPQHVIKNPVMALVWLATIISLISTLLAKTSLLFGVFVTVTLLVTVLFANYAEALAEARGRGQASSLRQARHNLMARRIHITSPEPSTGVNFKALDTKF